MLGTDLLRGPDFLSSGESRSGVYASYKELSGALPDPHLTDKEPEAQYGER